MLHLNHVCCTHICIIVTRVSKSLIQQCHCTQSKYLHYKSSYGLLKWHKCTITIELDFKIRCSSLAGGRVWKKINNIHLLEMSEECGWPIILISHCYYYLQIRPPNLFFITSLDLTFLYLALRNTMTFIWDGVCLLMVSLSIPSMMTLRKPWRGARIACSKTTANTGFVSEIASWILTNVKGKY